MKLKICGNMDGDNIQKVAGIGPDYMGFIFYPKSKRYAGNLEPQSIRGLPSHIVPVAVFVNTTYETIISTTKKYTINRVQLHGNEDTVLCSRLRDAGYVVIKTFSIGTAFDMNVIKSYTGCMDYVLFDTQSNNYGGSGETFDRSVIDKYTYDTPFFLSGGIGCDNIDAVMCITHPQLYAVDINSKIEREPGNKDREKIRYIKNRITK